MDIVYFFWPKNFKILNIYEVQDRTLTEVGAPPPDGVTRVTRYRLGGRVHTCLGTSWPPTGHTMRLPIAKAWVEPDLPMFGLDQLPFEPWRSQAARIRSSSCCVAAANWAAGGATRSAVW